MQLIDIHTHRHYQDETWYVYNAFLNDNKLPQRFSFGLHPWYIDNLEDNLIQLETLLRTHPNTLCIGECGLDKVCSTDSSVQQKAFEQQIALAEHYQKPVIIHCVRAYQECLQILKDKNVAVVFHGFNKNEILARQIVSQGYAISIGKELLSHPEKMQAILDAVPLEAVFLETDDAAIHIKELYYAVSNILKISVDDVILQVYKNFQKLQHIHNGKY